MKKQLVTWFGAALKEYRDQRNLTQAQLAERMGISPSMLSRWEGDVWPTLGNFCRACRKAKISPMVFIGDYFQKL